MLCLTTFCMSLTQNELNCKNYLIKKNPAQLLRRTGFEKKLKNYLNFSF
jgi:hypothetical protein